MFEEILEVSLVILEVLVIIREWIFIIKTEIEKIPNMAHINDISLDVMNKILIREDGRNKRYQTSKYTIINNGESCVIHILEKNHKVREKVTVPFPVYEHGEYNFKLIMKRFVYKILPKKKRGCL